MRRKTKYFGALFALVSDVKKDEIITKERIGRIRPDFGLDAKRYFDVIGNTFLQGARRGDCVTFKHKRRELSKEEMLRLEKLKGIADTLRRANKCRTVSCNVG